MSKLRSLSPFFFVLSVFISITIFSSFRADDELTKGILKHTNKFRESNGLKELEMREELNTIARKHSQDMASGRRAFGHAGFSQRGVAVSKYIKYRSIAENVAFGPTSGKEVVIMWKNSPGHRKNMLGNYKYIGIGTARNRQGVIYFTQIFVR